MTSSDRVIAALRRNLRLVVLCVIAGALAMVALTRLSTQRYTTTATLLVQSSGAPTSISGQSTSSDASSEAAAVTLGGSPDLFKAIASRVGESDWRAVQRAVKISAGDADNTIKVQATATSRERAALLSTAAATTVPAFQRTLYENSLSIYEQSLIRSVSNDPQNASLQAALARVRVLRSLPPSSAPLGVDTRSSSGGGGLARAVAQGLAVGLVLGLLLAALREAVTQLVDEKEVRRLLPVPVLATLHLSGRRLRRARKAALTDDRTLLEALDDFRQPGRGTVLVLTSAVEDPHLGSATAEIARSLHESGHSVAVVDASGSARLNALDAVGSSSVDAPPTADTADARADGDSEATMDAERLEADRLVAAAPGGHGEALVGAPPAPGPWRSGSVAAHQAPALRLLHANHARDQPRPWDRAVLDGLRDSYDWVLIDALPVLGSGRARRLSGSADAVLLVIPTESARYDDVVMLSDEVTRWARPPSGIVLAA